MKIGKPKSKRTPVRLRHKIEKASAAKQRKQRKEAKSNPQWRSRLKKDPGIPNLFPYKAKLLAEIEEGKRRKAEEQMQKREVAKARRQGLSVDATTTTADIDEDFEDDEEEDETEGGVAVLSASGDQDMDIDDQNPMAALLASAQARARTHGADDGEDYEDDEQEDEPEEDNTWNGIDESTTAGSSSKQQHATKKALPKRALDDPVKAVTLLIARLQKSAQNGMQTVIDYYQIPPLVSSGTDIATRFLVEVARKRGRLGRGGVPNLHAAALVVLNDINDERLYLPSDIGASTAVTPSTAAAGDVVIVKTMAAPFRIDGLWGDEAGGAGGSGQEMLIDS